MWACDNRYPTIEFFHLEKIRNMMVDLLFLFAKVHPDIAYRQVLYLVSLCMSTALASIYYVQIQNCGNCVFNIFNFHFCSVIAGWISHKFMFTWQFLGICCLLRTPVLFKTYLVLRFFIP